MLKSKKTVVVFLIAFVASVSINCMHDDPLFNASMYFGHSSAKNIIGSYSAQHIMLVKDAIVQKNKYVDKEYSIESLIPVQFQREHFLDEGYIRVSLLEGTLVTVLDYNKYLDEYLLLIIKREPTSLQNLLFNDKTLVNKQDDLLNATLLMYAAALGYDDIVDILLEHGADPLRETRQGKTVFDVIQQIFKKNEETHFLTPEQIACYEKIRQWCRIQVKTLYSLPVINIGKTEQERNGLNAALKNAIIPVLLGNQAASFKPSRPSRNTYPPYLDRRYPSLRSPYKRFLSFISNKKPLAGITMGAAGTIALGYAWYRYTNSQKAASTGDEQLAYNGTNVTEEYFSHDWGDPTPQQLPVQDEAPSP